MKYDSKGGRLYFHRSWTGFRIYEVGLRLWLDVADRRLREMKEGTASEVPADEVFARGRTIISR